MEDLLLNIVIFTIIGLFLFVLVILLIFTIIPLAMFLTKKLVKSKRLRRFVNELREEVEKEGDAWEGYVTISEIKNINDAQNVRIEALVIQNKEIIEKLNRLVEEKEGGNTK